VTEQTIMERLTAERRADRTVIIVAHRISTLKGADKILVFDHGALVEQGRFDELADNPTTSFGRMHAIQRVV